MKDRDAVSFKRVILNLLLAAVWIAVGYVVFVGGVCVWVGLSNAHRPGFWVPVLAGCLTIGIVLWSAFPVAGGLRAAFQGRAVKSDNGSY